MLPHFGNCFGERDTTHLSGFTFVAQITQCQTLDYQCISKSVPDLLQRGLYWLVHMVTPI